MATSPRTGAKDKSTEPKPVPPRRDFEALERRRMRAADLFRKGRQPAEVARELGVSIQTASEWRKRWSEGGKAALRSAGRAGRMPKLTRGQLNRVDAALRKGAKANGYPTELWTLPRVAEVIAKVSGVTYHPGHVWRILRQMGWSRQRPARRAAERDQAAIDTWVKQRWPAVKKNARRRGALIVFQDESGVSQLPAVRATWAPRGETPVLTHRFGWKRLSMSAAAVYEPDGSDAYLIFGTQGGAYNDVSLIEFLTDLHQELGGRKVTLIWDGLPSHRSRAMSSWIRRQRHWLVVEPLPAYAPDLNPVEGVWGNLKGTELANFCADHLSEAEEAAVAGLDRIGSDAELCFSLLRHCGLSL